MHPDPTARLILAATLQLALLGAITALAIAGVIPGSTVVALLGSHLAIRALASLAPPSGPGPTGDAGDAKGSSSSSSGDKPTRIGFVRSALSAAATACLRMVDPLAEVGAVLAGGAAVLELGQVRARPRAPRLGFVAHASLATVGALALALSLASCTPATRSTAAGVIDAVDGPACTLVSLFVGDRNAGVVCESISNLLESALSVRAVAPAPPDDPSVQPVAHGTTSCELAPLDDAGRPMGWICADLLPAARRALGTRHAR